MTKDEIKKALECCVNPSINPCKDCPYNKNGDFSYCNDKILKDTLNLITEQEKEVEQLTEERNRYAETLAKYQMASDKEIRAQKKQAVKEFAEKLRKRLTADRVSNDNIVINANYEIDELLKEYENDT